MVKFLTPTQERVSVKKYHHQNKQYISIANNKTIYLHIRIKNRFSSNTISPM
jgi:hypothetical protein